MEDREVNNTSPSSTTPSFIYAGPTLSPLSIPSSQSIIIVVIHNNNYYWTYYNNNDIINNIAEVSPIQEPIARDNPEPAAAPAAEAVRLNPAPAAAAAAAAAEADDEDFVQRDWIDWLSLITRAVALASFIYLYASFGRFMLVTVLYFFYRLITSVVEAYNAVLTIGAPRLAVPADQQNNGGVNNNIIDNPNNNININNNNNNNPNEDQNHLQQVMDGNIDNHHNANDNSNEDNSVDGQRNSNEQTKIRLFFIMIKALFSSLIPLQAPPLYPNRG